MIAVLLVMTLLSGCTTQTAFREQVVVTAIGIHQQEGTATVSVQAVDTLKTAANLAEQEGTATAVYTAQGESVSAALHAFLQEAGREATILQNQLVAVSEDTCRSGSLFDSVDYLTRHRAGQLRVPIVIVTNPPAELLECQSGNDAIPIHALVSMLQEGAGWGVNIRRTLLDVMLAGSGMLDMVLPRITVVDKVPTPSGVALFRNGRVVGQLDDGKTMALAVLADEAKRVLYTENGVTYEVVLRGTAVNIQQQEDAFTYRFTVQGRVNMVEKEQDSPVEIERVKRWLTQQCEQTLQTLDTVDCDALGLSRRTACAFQNTTQKTVRSQLAGYDKTVLVELD